jgi:flagellar motor protein MotB
VNRQLSQERAEAVRMYLVSAQHVPAERLKAVGKGDSEPMNTRDVAAAENRRVTIVTNTK